MAYTYLIGWSQHNKFYYGARWAKSCHPKDLWVTYFTSSKHVKLFREQYGEPNIIEIRKIFNDVDACRRHERKVLVRMKVLIDEKWLNKNINGLFLHCGPQSEEHKRKRLSKITGKNSWMYGRTGSLSPRYGKKHTQETIEKLSQPKSQEHKDKLPFNRLNKQTTTCPHCNKTGQYVNMKRWHFDNCRQSQSD